MDALSLMKLVSHETFVEDTQERGEQVFDQQNEDMDEEQEPEQDEAIQEPFSPAQQKEDEVSCFPSRDSNDTLILDLEGEEETEALDEVDVPCCAIKDKEAIHDDETITHAENTKAIEAPAQEETVSYPPPLVFDDALPCDEKEEEDEFSNLANPACYDTDSDMLIISMSSYMLGDVGGMHLVMIQIPSMT
jgi:hypothetical protein